MLKCLHKIYSVKLKGFTSVKSSLTSRVAIALGLLSLLLLLVVLAILTYTGVGTDGFFGFFVKNHLAVMILLVLVSIGTGGAMVVLLTQETAQQQKAASGTADLLLTFLAADERVVVEHLARNNGNALQSQLAANTGFSAVKMHRLLSRLQAKRFLTLERYGKTNRALLAPELLASVRAHSTKD